MADPERPEAPTAAEQVGQLGRAAITASGWLMLSMFATALMQLLSAGVLGRLLSPEDFGIVALAALVMRFVQYFSQFGIGNALVQKHHLARSDVSTAILLSVLIGASCSILGFLLSPIAGWLLNRDEVVAVTKVLASTLLATSLGVVPLALLRRQMRFKAIAVLETTSYGVGYLLVGIASALFLQAGYWSLVYAALTQAVVQVVLAGIVAHSDLTVGRPLSGARALLGFGGMASLAGFLEFWSLQIDSVGLARGLGATALGQYNRGTILVYPIAQVAVAITRVLLSTFARLAPGDRTRTAYWDSLTYIATAVLLSAGVVGTNASVLVRTVLGEQWTGTISVLPLLALATALQGMSQMPAALCEARAVLGLKVLVQTVTLATFCVAIIACLVLGAGLKAYAASWVLAEMVRNGAYLLVTSRRFELGWSGHFVIYAQAIALTIPACVASHMLSKLTMAANFPIGLQLIVAMAGGFSSAAILLAMWPSAIIRRTGRRRRFIDSHVRGTVARRLLTIVLG